MIRSLTCSILVALLALAPAAFAQTQTSPNVIARGNAYTTLSASVAISYCGARVVCEWHINGLATVAASVTIPANITPVFEGGGQLAPASGVIVTIASGKIVALPGVQVFAGAGSVTGIHVVDPRWYPAGYTLSQIVSLTPDVPDSAILLPPFSIDSGSENSTITRTNLTLIGQGRIAYNADFSAYQPGGSIIQGQLALSVPNLSIRNVGFDLGTYQAAHGGWCGADASGNNSTGNLVDIKLPGGNKSSISVADVHTLGCTKSTGIHSILIEGFDGVEVQNIHTHFNTRGAAIKSSNAYITNVDSQQHAAECLIFKADYTNGGVSLVNLSGTNVNCDFTGLIDLFGDDAGLSNIKLTNVSMTNGGYLDLNGYTISHGGSVDAVDITNFQSSGAAGNAIQTVGGIGSVRITGGGAYGFGQAAIFANSGQLLISNFMAGIAAASAYGIYNNGANMTIIGGGGINLANAYIHGVQGSTAYVGSSEFGNAGIVADGNAVLNVPVPYDNWGAGNLTAPYGAQNYFAKFTPSDSRYDHGVSAFGWGTAQHIMYAGNAATNEKRSILYNDASGVTHLGLFDDTLNGTTSTDAITITRSGYTPTGVALGAPVTAPSVETGSTATGSCSVPTGYVTLTIAGTLYKLATCN